MSKLSLILIFFVIGVNCLCQNCIFYGEFDDNPCNSCAPSGWDPILAAEIDDEATLSWCPNLVESPTGETMVALDIVASNAEGIETTITGLTPGTTYSLGFYWFCCEFLDPADLTVEVDGTLYSFPPVFEWTVVSMCVTAESSTMDITVTAETHGNQSFVFVDDVDCEDVEVCCSLQVDLEDEFFVCPNEELTLDAIISMEQGDVTYEWTSDPEDGIDFLSDPNIEDPIFLLDGVDVPYEGIEYEFTLLVEDEFCANAEKTIVTVYPLVEITFDFDDEYCETDGEFTFPLISNEGYSGTWDTPSINLNDFGGMEFENTFMIDDNQVDCPLPFTFEIDIETVEIPEFEFELVFCEHDEEFIFPETSINNIEGFWDIPELIPSDYSPDEYLNSFTPYDDFCVSTIEVEFEIIESIKSVFSLEDTICNQSASFTLPTESNNNIDGNWTPEMVNPSMIEDSLVCIFTSDEDMCIEDYRHVFYPSDNVNAQFNIADTICRNSPAIILEPVSIDGYSGIWNIQSFAADTVASDSINIIWIPDSNMNCLDTFQKTIYIDELAIPEFDIPTSLCITDDAFLFPTLSINNISGSWTSPELLPSNIGNGAFNNSFVPDDNSCASQLDISISIVDEIIPQFDIPDTICAQEASYSFPLNSLENIEGDWTTAAFSPADYEGQTFTNTFMANSNNSCVLNEVDIDIFVRPLEQSIFDIPEILCHLEGDFSLPVASLNSIAGSWNISSFNTSDYVNSSIDLEFTPDDSDCNAVYQTSILVTDQFSGSLDVSDATDCNSNNGSLSINSSQGNFEYSIDEGANWQTTSAFSNLEPGQYELWIRNSLLEDCLEVSPFLIDSPLLPQIEDVLTTQNTSCLAANGIIEIVMMGSDFEFSIDNGVSWQVDNIFPLLEGGNYTIQIRPQSAPDCIISTTAIIEDVEEIIIENIIAVDPSGCESEDGTIEIIATGSQLQFSIDAGTSLSDNNIFENLPAGEYDIFVSSDLYPDCIAIESVTLNSVDVPIIDNVVSTNPNACTDQLGSISIESSSDDIEYSIDNGITWQADNTFDNLPDGDYQVMIQSTNHSDCFSIVIPTTLTLEDIDLLADLDLRISDPSDCENSNGIIDLGIENSDLEFSIDQGTTWQNFSTFENLSSGEYDVIVRLITDPGCSDNIENITLNFIPCPCEDITYEINKSDIICSIENNGTIDISNIIGFANQINDVIWSDGPSGLSREDLTDGWYYFTVHYDMDCVISDSIFIERFDPLDFFLESFDNQCGEDNNGTIEISEVSGGSGVYNYSLNNTIFQDDPVFYNLPAGEFEALVLDSIGCLKSEFLEILQGTTIDINLPEVISIEQGQSTYLNPLINENTIDSFTWSLQQYILNPGELIAQVAPEETTEFELTIYYEECTEIRTVIVEVINTSTIYVGSIFSPNGDSNNDYFYLQSEDMHGFEINRFSIYDRWGNRVFSKNSPQVNLESDGWDGRFGDQDAMLGVYVYLVEYVDNGQVKTLAGSVTLVR